MTDRITELIHRAAEQAAPDTLDLWPRIQAQIQPAPPAPRQRGVLTLAAAGVIVVTAVILLLAFYRPASHPVRFASLDHSITPTVSPEQTSQPDGDLCTRYPLYCVPLVGGAAADSPLSAVDAPIAERRSYPGIVRGISPDGLPFIGNPAAPVRIEVVQDFACPHCADYYLTDLRRFIQDSVLTGQAALELRLITRVGGELPAEAALCAGEQDAFWEMTDALFNLNAITAASIHDTAASLGLDTARLESCIASGKFASVLEAQGQDLDGEAVPTVWLKGAGSLTQIERGYDSLMSVTSFLSQNPGLTLPPTTYLTSDNYADGAFTVEGALTAQTPRNDFAQIDGFNDLYDALDAANGWALLTVDGLYYTPSLTVEQKTSTQRIQSRYDTQDGALLFDWTNNGTAGHYHEVEYTISVEGNRSILLANYTLTLRPLTDVIDLSQGMQDIAIERSTPQVLAFSAPNDHLYRLTIEVTQTMSFEEALSSTYNPLPDLALILPHGTTLGRFNPAQTKRFEVDFMPPLQGQQYLVINPLDLCLYNDPLDVCQQDTRSAIQLRVSVAPVETETANEFTPLPSGTVDVSLPLADHITAEGMPGDLAGTLVDLYMSLIYVDLGDDTQDIASQLTPGEIIITGSSPIQITTQRVITHALVTMGQQNTITLNVTPQDATVLEWAVQANIPIRIVPADTSPMVDVTYTPGDPALLADHQPGDAVTITLAANDLHISDQTVSGTILSPDDTGPRIVLHQVTVTAVTSGSVTLSLPPIEAAILQWALDESVPLTIE